MKKILLLLCLNMFFIIGANAASVTFNKVYPGTGTSFTLNSSSIAWTSQLSGTAFKFTSANPADVTFSGNNVAGQFTYMSGGMPYAINGVISRKVGNGNSYTAFYFVETTVLGGSTVTGKGWLFIVPTSDGSYTTNSSASTNSAPVKDDLNAFLTTQNSNYLPVITSNGGGTDAYITMSEGSTAVTTVTATDQSSGDTKTFTISGGVDAAKFTINSSTGVLTFVSAPDYENPTDAGLNNVYDVQVTVTDSQGATDVQSIHVTITNLNDNSPVITSDGGGTTATIGVVQGSTTVTTVTATDADYGDVLTYSISGGTNSALFNINPSSGALTFKTAATNGSYQVAVTVTDASGHTDVQTITVNVATTDTTAPSLVITSSDSNLSAAEVCTIYFKFSEQVQGFVLGDVTYAGGTLTGLTQNRVDPTLYSATFTQSGSSTAPSFSVASGSYQDLSGNNGTAASLILSYDVIAPTVAVTFASPDIAYGETDVVTFTFSENPGTSFTLSDISVTNATLSNLVQTADPKVWTATIQQNSAVAAPVVTVTNLSYTDLAGNPGSSGTATIPVVPPTIDLANTVTSDTGISSTDNITTNRKPVVTGAVDNASSTVTVNVQYYVSGTLTTLTYNSVAVNGTTHIYSLDLSAVTPSTGTMPAAGLPEGYVTLVVTTPTSATASSQFLIDLTAPSAPTVTSLTTYDQTPTIQGTATVADGEVLTVTVNGRTYTNGDGYLVLNGTAWTLSVPLVYRISSGTYSVTATVTDLAGNATSDATSSELVINASSVTVDLRNNATDDTGASSTDNITTNRKPIISGTATGSDATVKVTVVSGGYTYVYNSVAVSSNAFTLDLSSAVPSSITPTGIFPTDGLPQGTISLTVEGNTSGAVGTNSFSIIFPPTVTTTAASSITSSTASSGGNVTADGGSTITSRGVCWSTSSNPTTSNSKTTDAGTTGSYTSSLTSLTAGTTYYIRAYAINDAGTSYGPEVSFTTTSATPTVTVSASLSSFTTVYGTASAAQSFTVSGSNLSTNITLTAPADYEISLSSGSGYGSSLVLSQSGGSVSSTTIYARLKTGTGMNVGTYNSEVITVASTGATTGNVTCNGTITTKSLTITGISGVNKVYDGTTFATLSGTAAYSGLVNGDAFSVSGSPSATFASKNVADNISVTVSGYTVPSSNYTLSQPAVSANITAKALTITGITAQNKVYDGSTTATLSGTASYSGLVSGESFPVSGTPSATFASKNVADNIYVTVSGYTVPSSNYTLSQPSLNANISAKELTIAGASAQDKAYDGTTTAVIEGTLAGVVEPDDVTLTLSGYFSSASVGTGKSVTSNSTIGGAGAGNYYLTQPAGLTASIYSDMQTSYINVTDTSFTYLTLQWTKGSKANRVVFLKEGTGSAGSNPVNGTTYTASSNWNSKGTQLGTTGFYCVYNGTGTGVTLTNLYPGTVYTVHAFEYSGTAGSESYLTIAGSENPVQVTPWNSTTFTNSDGVSSLENWITAARWDHGIPSLALHDAVTVYIDGNCQLTTTEQTQVKNLTIKASHSSVNPKLTIQPAAKLNVTGSVTNYRNTNGLLIKSSASQPNGTFTWGSGTVNATVEMYSKASWDLNQAINSKYNWQFFGIPVQTVTAGSTFNFSNCYVRKWDESVYNYDSLWIRRNNGTTLYQNASSVLAAGDGFELVQQSPTTYVFTGALVHGNFSKNLSYTAAAAFPGQNIISNPFVAAVPIRSIEFSGSVEQSVYIFNSGTYNDWLSNTGTSNSGTKKGMHISASKNAAGSNGIPSQVPSMQGFLVKATGSGASVSIPYSILVPDSSLQRVKQNDNGFGNVSLRVNVAGETTEDDLWIFTSAGCTNKFDNGWDTRKMLNTGTNSQLYAQEVDDNYQIDAVSDMNGINMCFRPGNDDEYTFTFTGENTNQVYSGIYLVDQLENKTIDISESGTKYKFVALKDSKPNRFKIVTNKYFDSTSTQAKSIKVFNTHDEIVLQNESKEAGVYYLTSTSGNIVQTINFAAMEVKSISTKGLATGMYIVCAATNSERLVKRLMIY